MNTKHIHNFAIYVYVSLPSLHIKSLINNNGIMIFFFFYFIDNIKMIKIKNVLKMEMRKPNYVY